MNSERRRHKPDYWLPILATVLLSVGMVTVYSIAPGVSLLQGNDVWGYFGKHLIAALAGIVVFMGFSRFNRYENLRKYAVPVMVIALILGVGVLTQEPINGARRWYDLKFTTFQIAEFIKFALLLWAADLLAKRKGSGEVNDLKKTLQPLGIALVAVFVIVAGLQSDLGSAMVMVAMLGAMLLVAGLYWKYLLYAAVAVGLLALIFIGSSGYRRDRIKTFFNPTADCQNEGYQSCQAVIAVGSGGMFGLGLARSVQAYGYLPEASNDSIFAILAENFGFLGVTLIVAAYAMLFTRLTRIIERSQDDFSKLLVTGVLAWFSFQAIINIGAMIGLLPLKGITLPFVSTGGTSLLFVTGALGLVFQISGHGSLGRLSEREESSENTTYRRGNRRTHHPSASRR